MQNCEFVTFISILACTIAKDKTQEELALLSAIFTQLRRYTSNTRYIRHKKIKNIISTVDDIIDFLK